MKKVNTEFSFDDFIVYNIDNDDRYLYVIDATTGETESFDTYCDGWIGIWELMRETEVIEIEAPGQEYKDMLEENLEIDFENGDIDEDTYAIIKVALS